MENYDYLDNNRIILHRNECNGFGCCWRSLWLSSAAKLMTRNDETLIGRAGRVCEDLTGISSSSLFCS